jgi:hypothetical protein
MECTRIKNQDYVNGVNGLAKLVGINIKILASHVITRLVTTIFRDSVLMNVLSNFYLFRMYIIMKNILYLIFPQFKLKK